MKHLKLYGKLQIDGLIINDTIPSTGGYQNMMKSQKFLIQVENLVNLHLLIERMM